MNTVTINLFSFSELSKEAKKKAVIDHSIFLNEVDAKGREYDNEETIESIEVNEYLYFEDGTLAPCTTYTGKHPKSGTTELKLHGSVYAIN